MKYLTLLRHAKSSWADGVDDRDRTLNARGRRDAPEMARRLLDANCIPDRICCSSAARTLETADLLLDTWSLPSERLIAVDALYLASLGELQAIVGEQEGTAINHLMVIAHNPGLETLSQWLANGRTGSMPTCAVNHFELDQDDFDLTNPDRATLVYSDYPKSSQD